MPTQNQSNWSRTNMSKSKDMATCTDPEENRKSAGTDRRASLDYFDGNEPYVISHSVLKTED